MPENSHPVFDWSLHVENRLATLEAAVEQLTQSVAKLNASLDLLQSNHHAVQSHQPTRKPTLCYHCSTTLHPTRTPPICPECQQPTRPSTSNNHEHGDPSPSPPLHHAQPLVIPSG